MSRRPTKKRRGCWERRLASAAPRDSVGPDRGEVEIPDRAVDDIGEVVGSYDRLARLDEREHGALLVEQRLQLLVELATGRIVGRGPRARLQVLDVRGGAGQPAGTLADQLAGQECQVVVGIGVVGRPAGEAQL